MGLHPGKNGRPILDSSAFLTVDAGLARRLATQAADALPATLADHDELVGDHGGCFARGGRPAQVGPFLLRSGSRAQHAGDPSKESFHTRKPILEFDRR